MTSILIPYGFFNPTPLAIPANGQVVTFSERVYNSWSPEMQYIWLLASHTHSRGIDYDMYEANPDGTRGTQIYEGFYNADYTFNQGFYDWAHPPVRIFEPSYPINSEYGIIHEAKFLNTTGETIYYGLTTEDEMMIFYAQYTLAPILITGNEENHDIHTIPLSLNPNPVNERGTLYFKLENRFNVVVEVYDVLGHKAFTIFHEQLEKGINRLEIDVKQSGLRQGMYLIKLTAGKQTAVTRMMVSNVLK